MKCYINGIIEWVVLFISSFIQHNGSVIHHVVACYQWFPPLCYSTLQINYNLSMYPQVNKQLGCFKFLAVTKKLCTFTYRFFSEPRFLFFLGKYLRKSLKL